MIRFASFVLLLALGAGCDNLGLWSYEQPEDAVFLPEDEVDSADDDASNDDDASDDDDATGDGPADDDDATDDDTADDASDDDDDATQDDDDATQDDDDAAIDDDDTGVDDDDATPDPLAGLNPAQAWIRTNPMFVSALTVTMAAPSAPAADQYFDAFGASAAHLWARGLPNRVAGWQAARGLDMDWLSWVQSDGTSIDGGAVIGGLGPNPPGRIGYQVGDEPRNFADVAEISLGVDAVRAADPDALIVINFGHPDDGLEFLDVVEEAAATVDFDIVSYDYYNRGYNEIERMALVRQFGLDHDMPYWRYLKSFQFVDEYDWSDATDMRWDAMSGVVQGYTGHTWFIYQNDPIHPLQPSFFGAPGSWNHATTPRFDVVAELNAELAYLGQVLPWLTSTEVRYTPGVALYAPDGLSAWSPGAGGDPWIASIEPVGLLPWDIQDVHVGFFEDADGELYVALQNPTHEASDWPIMTTSSTTFEVRFDFAGAPPSLDPAQLLVLDHHAEAVVAEPLAIDGGQRVLTVALEAGDLVFWKYDTGRGFAGLDGT